MFVCRLCLSNSSEEHYSLNYGELKDKLQACIPEMEEVHLNNAKICILCYNNLNVAYDFREKCLTSLQDNAVIDDPILEYPRIDHTMDNAKIDDPIIDYPRIDPIIDYSTIDHIIDDATSDHPIIQEPIIDNVIIIDDDDIKIEPKQEFTDAELPRYGLPKIEEILPIKEEPIENNPVTTTPNEVQTHNLINHDLLCKICYRQYSNKSCFYRHLKVTHNIHKKQPANTKKTKRLKQIMKLIPSNEYTLIQNELLSPCEPITCKICDITLNCEHELKYHNAFSHLGLSVPSVHFTIFCNKCKSKFSHKYLNEHLVSHKYKVRIEDIFKEVDVPKDGPFVIVKFWKCDICNQFFESPKESLDHHFLNHGNMVD